MGEDYHKPFYETCCEDDDEIQADRSRIISARQHAKGLKVEPEVKIGEFSSEFELNDSLDQWLPKSSDPLAEKWILKDSLFPLISECLAAYGKGEWSLRPRLFAILRILGCVHLLDEFIKDSLTDSALPFSEGNLPDAVKGHTLRTKFLKLQNLVTCKEAEISELERGGKHIHLSGNGDDYFQHKQPLGQGRVGVVDVVVTRGSLLPFARKTITRGYSALSDKAVLKQFEQELQALKRLSHEHIVRLVGSYSDEKTLGLIMSPIAEKNLREFLEDTKLEIHILKRRIRPFFGCLATALAYLHLKGVRHNDIKPENILIKGFRVYITDFGTSRAWTPGEHSTSSGKHEGYTWRYCAPEALENTTRNTASDVWSLGCVFLEMATVLANCSLKQLGDFYLEHGHQRLEFWANTEANETWVAHLTKQATQDEAPLHWIPMMMQYEITDRPTAAQLRGKIMNDCNQNEYICHLCCSPGALASFGTVKAQSDMKSQGQVDSDKMKSQEQLMRITASELGRSERPSIPKDKAENNDTPLNEEHSSASVASQNAGVFEESVYRRFIGLPIGRRPASSVAEEVTASGDTSFIHPERVKPPPFLQKDCMPLPAATLVPSYILAGTNRFSAAEISGKERYNPMGSNLFVYGRLMFPSALHAVANSSLQAVYAPELRRRLMPSTGDWAKADVSIKHAAEIMTPARLKGYDRWRPKGLCCAVIQDSRLSGRISDRMTTEGHSPINPPGQVFGFLVVGIRSDALRYCDLLFCSDWKTLQHMKPHDDNDADPSDGPSLHRERVNVEVELRTGEISNVPAYTYVWSNGIHELHDVWEEERFLRSPIMQSLLDTRPHWTSEEQLLAANMRISFAHVGDYLVGAIMANQIDELAGLLANHFCPNAPCRLYGYPLQAAVSAGSIDMVGLLLEEGAEVNAHGGQYGTALIAAAYANRLSIMKMLLHHGADVLADDKIHVNALYQTVAHGDYATTEMLLEHGAWVCKGWREIIQLAEELKNSRIQGLLEAYDVRQMGRIRKQLTYRDHRHENRHTEASWELMSYTKVSRAIVMKILAVSSMSGNWKGRKGVAVTAAALKAGAPLELIGVIRDAVNPIKALITVIRKADAEQEMAQEFDNSRYACCHPVLTTDTEDTRAEANDIRLPSVSSPLSSRITDAVEARSSREGRYLPFLSPEDAYTSRRAERSRRSRSNDERTSTSHRRANDLDKEKDNECPRYSHHYE